MEILERILIERVIINTDKVKARNLERYVRLNVKSHGVGVPALREILDEVVSNAKLNTRPIAEQLELCDLLMQNEYTEPKLLAILYLVQYTKATDHELIIRHIDSWFADDLIFDWNVCDWLSARFLSKVLDANPELMEPILKGWVFETGLWKSRAALVAFSESKEKARHLKTTKLMCRILIKREERFSKTAVGRALKNYAIDYPDFVNTFLAEFEEYLIPEVVISAKKHLSK